MFNPTEDENFLEQTFIHITHLVLLVGATLFKKRISLVVSNRNGMKFGTTVLYANTHRLTESDF